MYNVDDEFDIVRCFALADKLSDLSMDDRFNLEQRELLLSYSDRVLAKANTIQHKQFEDGIYQLRHAGLDLSASNERIDKASQDLNNMAEALHTVDSLLKNLSQFITIMSKI